MGEYREFGGVWMVGEFLVVGEVVSSMGEIWKEWGNVWVKIREDVGRCVGGVGKCVWGVGRGDWKGCWGGGNVRGDGGAGKCGTIRGCEKVWEKGGVTIRDPHLPLPPTPLPHTHTSAWWNLASSKLKKSEENSSGKLGNKGNS